MRSTVAPFVLLLTSAISLAGAQPRQAGSPQSEMKAWNTPFDPGSRARDPFADEQGRVWFVGQQGNYIAYLEPKDGSFKKYEIDPGTHPHNLVIHKGSVWYTGNRNGRIVNLDPNTGKLTTFKMPDSTVRDPHTMLFDQNGDAWFTAQNSDAVGKLTTKTGEVRIWKTGTRTRPYGLILDSQGRPYFDLFATNKIGTIDPKTMELKTFTLPDSTLPRRIAITDDTTIWYGDYRRGYLGRLNPKTGATQQWLMPGGHGSMPYGMATDDLGRIWVAETGTPRAAKLHVFDPKKNAWVESIAIPSDDKPNTIRHMQWDKATRQIWFGGDANMIGRIKVAPAAVVP
jgi:virginiamycin B lyase